MKSATSNHDLSGISYRDAARATLRELERAGRPDVLLSHVLSGVCPDHNQLLMRDVGNRDIAVVNDEYQVALLTGDKCEY